MKVVADREFYPMSGNALAGLTCLGLLVTAVVIGPSRAAVIGGARVIPIDQAVERSRLAAEAVIQRRGKETCLRGKFTNALLGLSASCEAVGQRSGLCALADQAVVQTGWSMAFMDATAHQLLDLLEVKPIP